LGILPGIFLSPAFISSPSWRGRLKRAKQSLGGVNCLNYFLVIVRRKQFFIYIMTNKNNTTLYIGVTSDWKRRVFEHKNKLVEGFTKKYNINKLVFYEVYDDINNAIAREKQIKGGSRAKKIKLIEEMNCKWNDLFEEI
jgi:putative endonuclease